MLRCFDEELVGRGADQHRHRHYYPDRGLARLIADIATLVAVSSSIHQNRTDPAQALDFSKLTALGWRPRIDLQTGIRQTYQWYRTSGATSSRAGSDSHQGSREPAWRERA